MTEHAARILFEICGKPILFGEFPCALHLGHYGSCEPRFTDVEPLRAVIGKAKIDHPEWFVDQQV